MNLDRGATLIAILPFKFAGTDHQPGDVFAWQEMDLATPAKVGVQVKNRRVAELSRSSILMALKRRGRDLGFPAGLTPEGLAGMGILTDEEALQYMDAADAGPWSPKPVEGAEAQPELIEKVWIIPGKGPIPAYALHDRAGGALNEGKKAKGRNNAVELAKTLSADLPDLDEDNESGDDKDGVDDEDAEGGTEGEDNGGELQPGADVND